MKTFTLEEAQALLPVLGSLLKRALDARQSAVRIDRELQQLSQRIYLSGGMNVDVLRVSRQRAALDDHLQQVQDSVAEIDSIGVEVKDLESGLLDFPCRIEDEVVLLCWKQGEPRIAHWHTMDDGFRGRKPIDERFRRTKPN